MIKIITKDGSNTGKAYARGGGRSHRQYWVSFPGLLAHRTVRLNVRSAPRHAVGMQVMCACVSVCLCLCLCLFLCVVVCVLARACVLVIVLVALRLPLRFRFRFN